MGFSILFLATGKGLLFTLAAILPIINPLATAPLFVDFTHGMDRHASHRLASSIGRHVVLLLAGALLIGSYVLRFFGVSLPVVRVAGGLIVASMAWQLLNTQRSANTDKAHMAQTLSDEDVSMSAFYPMTFPLTCGPGSISVAIAVGASLQTPVWGQTVANFAGGLVAVVLLGLIVTLTFRYADKLLGRLGEVGHIVFLRLMAFILLCVGIEIMWEGVRALWGELAVMH
ncbi:MAG: NAAT family transporter [Burkholderiaceae bacterium]|jgi:multiple antibiotic resistance protein|nr:MAG: NAAT family transporter [Burkholderiaceae bacterium]